MKWFKKNILKVNKKDIHTRGAFDPGKHLRWNLLEKSSIIDVCQGPKYASVYNICTFWKDRHQYLVSNNRNEFCCVFIVSLGY